jgi:hypothetical protein
MMRAHTGSRRGTGSQGAHALVNSPADLAQGFLQIRGPRRFHDDPGDSAHDLLTPRQKLGGGVNTCDLAALLLLPPPLALLLMHALQDIRHERTPPQFPDHIQDLLISTINSRSIRRASP